MWPFDRIKYPYTDFHQLNADWIIDTIKSLGELASTALEGIQGYAERLTAVETKNTEQDTSITAIETVNGQQEDKLSTLFSRTAAQGERLTAVESVAARAVSYDPQTASPADKTQACNNIGAVQGPDAQVETIEIGSADDGTTRAMMDTGILVLEPAAVVRGVLTPQAAGDAANKAYVDNHCIIITIPLASSDSNPTGTYPAATPVTVTMGGSAISPLDVPALVDAGCSLVIRGIRPEVFQEPWELPEPNTGRYVWGTPVECSQEETVEGITVRPFALAVTLPWRNGLLLRVYYDAAAGAWKWSWECDGRAIRAQISPIDTDSGHINYKVLQAAIQAGSPIMFTRYAATYTANTYYLSDTTIMLDCVAAFDTSGTDGVVQAIHVEAAPNNTCVVSSWEV